MAGRGGTGDGWPTLRESGEISAISHASVPGEGWRDRGIDG